MPGTDISWAHLQALQRVESQKERVKAGTRDCRVDSALVTLDGPPSPP